MDIQGLAKKLEGLQTVSSISKILDIDRRTAINYIFLLRKKGFVGTLYGKRKIRMYRIRTVQRKERGYEGLYEIINKNSKVKLVEPYREIVYTHKLSFEEAIVRAVKSGKFRLILASLGLFNKIKNWHRLFIFAKKENVGRKIGALYDITRKIIKVKKMDERTRKALLKTKMDNKFIVDKVKSKDFKEIGKIWKVYIPFNKADLEVYKE